MADREPNVKDKHDDSEVSVELREFLSKLIKRVQEDGDNRIGWLRKLVTSNNQRLGIKRVSTRPWMGAPNIPLPEADKLIKKNKPNYVLSSYLPKKKAFVKVAEGTLMTEELRQKSIKAEKGLNHILNNKIDLLNVFTLASDNFLEMGHCIFKVIEKFTKTLVHKVIDLSDFDDERVKALKALNKVQLRAFVADRFDLDDEDKEDSDIISDAIKQLKEGKEIIRFDMHIIESFPDILVRPPERVTPPSFALEIEEVERLNDEFFLTRRQLEERAEQGIYSKKVVKEIEKADFSGKGKSATEDSMIETQKERNEGIVDEGNEELFRIHEIYAWWKSGDTWERWVFTILADVADVETALLRKIRFPFDIKTWNFIKHDNELKDSRWHASRGIPEMIRALQEFMERSINNMLIRDEINNAPLYTVLSNSNIQSNTIRFIPGQKVKVKNHDEIKRLDDRQVTDQSSERINQILKAYAEEYLSSTDQLFRNATNKGGGKTLGEVKIGVQISSAPNMLAVLRWLVTLKKLYTMVFDILKERVGESMFIDGTEITREDFNFPAEIIPNGSIDLAEQATRVGKAMQRLEFTVQGPQDILTADDRYNAARDWLEADGVMDPDRYITKPEIIQQQQKQQLQEEDQILAQQEQGLTQEIRTRKAEAVTSGAGQPAQRS